MVLLQIEPQQEPMVIGQPSMQRIVRLLATRFDPMACEFRPTSTEFLDLPFRNEA